MGWHAWGPNQYPAPSAVTPNPGYSPVCSHFTLHRLRKTCVTHWMEAGISIRTIQHLLGHKDLTTTQRYLGVGNIEELRGKIDAAFGD